MPGTRGGPLAPRKHAIFVEQRFQTLSTATGGQEVDGPSRSSRKVQQFRQMIGHRQKFAVVAGFGFFSPLRASTRAAPSPHSSFAATLDKMMASRTLSVRTALKSITQGLA